MRWQETFPKLLVFAGLPICIGVIIVLAVLSRDSVTSQSGSILSNTPTPDYKMVMLDPQGDADLASRIHPSTIRATTLKIILSRKVRGYQLPCLGFHRIRDPFTGDLDSHPADTFGLVVLGGDLFTPDVFPATESTSRPVPYIAYFYDVLGYGNETASAELEWSALRAAFGGPGWPEDSPMYVSPDGQPSLAELDPAPWMPYMRSWPPIRGHASPQILNVSQESDGWKVIVARVYAEGNTISLDYTVTGPHSRYKLDLPVLSVEGKGLMPSSTGPNGEVLGPAVWSVSAFGLSETAQPREVAVHLVVPAIHVRPPLYPCEEPGTPPAENPPLSTSTPAPENIPPNTPVPDVKTVGPFIFDLKVIVQPRPTERPVPSPVPTSTGLRIPLPQPTRQP